MPMFTVRFAGICCFIDGRERDTFVKRAILPADRHPSHHHHEPHIPYVEIETRDLMRGAKIAPSKEFVRGERDLARSFYRFDLVGERVSVHNAGQGNGRLVVVPTFSERVPSMTLVCPGCPPNPSEDCFSATPPPDLVAAYFDLRTGFLNAGPLDPEETRFDTGSNWPTRKLTRWAQLDLEYHGDHAEILLEKFDGSSSRTIPLNSEAGTITIGNQVETDIEETSMRGTDRRAHFEMYYGLASELPTSRPAPCNPAGILHGCAPLNWP